MIKYIICLVWGHKTVYKEYTGGTIKYEEVSGNKYTRRLFKFKTSDYCLRCGKVIKEK